MFVRMRRIVTKAATLVSDDTFGCADFRPFCADRQSNGHLSTLEQPPLPGGIALDRFALCTVEGEMEEVESDCRAEVAPAEGTTMLLLTFYCPEG